MNEGIRLIGWFRTNQCDAIVTYTGVKQWNKRIYCLRTYRRSTNKTNTRFGTRKQIEQMISTFRPRVDFEWPKEDL